MVVIPHVQKVISWVVIHGSDVLVGIREGYVDGGLLALISVVHIVNLVPRPFIVIVFVDRFDHIEDAANHEGVGGGALVVAGVPGALDPQSVRVQLAHHDAPVVLLRCIDHPQPVFVHGEVNVRLAAPAVRRRVVVVGVSDYGLAAFDACTQVKLHNVASALFVEEKRTIVDDEARPVHPMG